MDENAELASRARAVIDANKYMVLGTADPEGQPWVTPVYFTPDRYTDFYWTSSPDATHSRNLANRPELSLVIFDSQVPIGGAQAVYVAARAELVPDAELEHCAELFGGRFPELSAYSTAEKFRPPEVLRLYRARALEHSILIRGSDPVFGKGIDSRRTVDLTAG
jgi:hypothetical protein